MSDPRTKQTRRGFLDWIIALGSSMMGLALVAPALAYLWPAARRGGGTNVEVKGADGIALGQATMLQVDGKAAIIVRHRDGFRAFSAICTHLGCLVRWDGDQKEFLCPCHAAVFDENGRVVSGPPPAPLAEYKVSEVSGKVFISAA